jgi:hypothetical protein
MEEATMTTEAPKKTEDQPLVKHGGERTSGGAIQRLQVTSFAELERLATILAKSDIVPKDMIGKPANVLLALMFGNEIGLTPAQSLQNVMIVNGRPSLWGDAVMGLVENSNLQEWWKDEYKPDVDGGTWYFTTKRKGREPVTRSFSEKDAIAAKLDKKDGPWQQYKPRMKFHRARSWALRDTYPDVLKGIRYYEEERDVIDTHFVEPAKTYSLPTEVSGARPAPTPEAPPASEAPKGAPAEQTGPVDGAAGAPAPAPEGQEVSFKVSGGATAELDGDACFVIRDDASTPIKYYHATAEWHALAKSAKESGVVLNGRWVERPTKKGPVRWLTALGLRG